MSKKTTKPVITKLVLINLHISWDSGRRTMKALSKKIADDNDADSNMVTTSIKLIPPDRIKPFTTSMSRCRQFYLSGSLPWEDGNWRVVPVTKFQQFKDDIEKLISECKDEFDRCIMAKYDELKKLAEKRKGKIVVEFPSKDELMSSFNIEYNLGAIASSDDIRIVGIDSAMRKKIQTETEDRYSGQLEKGLTELAGNLTAALDELSERVGDDDQKGKKYTRFLENLKNQVDTVEALNITDNKVLKTSCEAIRKNISNWSPNAIKENKEVRDSIKASAGSVKDQLQGVSLDAEEDEA